MTRTAPELVPSPSFHNTSTGGHLATAWCAMGAMHGGSSGESGFEPGRCSSYRAAATAWTSVLVDHFGTTPEMTPPLQTSSPRQREDVWPLRMIWRATGPIDGGSSVKSGFNLRSFGPEIESLPLGHSGLSGIGVSGSRWICVVWSGREGIAVMNVRKNGMD
ncbi:hypothetical protein AVEN_27840-1 [Araneus ventricosus]|uniref:Uncharacterized protein n=1 Tax=Araneus ventricosus TaxID=182803 RepID=A0A4Y2GRP7_ARAVE|nr:hypothetical protein AVEN_27840-1 [Araneus ventricosus]